MCAKLLQSCPTLCDPMDCSPPVSSVSGILQARMLERIAVPYSRGRVTSTSCPEDAIQAENCQVFTLGAIHCFGEGINLGFIGVSFPDLKCSEESMTEDFHPKSLGKAGSDTTKIEYITPRKPRETDLATFTWTFISVSVRLTERLAVLPS